MLISQMFHVAGNEYLLSMYMHLCIYLHICIYFFISNIPNYYFQNVKFHIIVILFSIMVALPMILFLCPQS